MDLFQQLNFVGPSVETDNELEVYVAAFSSERLSSLGPAISLYDEINVYWLPTAEYPHPSYQWLAANFPSADEIVAGIKAAFDEYRDVWCGADSTTQILRDLDGKQKQLFLRSGWTPFVSVDYLMINPTANVTACEIDCYIDENLSEHGIVVMRIGNEWKFGYGADESQYFADWQGT